MIRLHAVFVIGLFIVVSGTQLHAQTSGWLLRLSSGADIQASGTPGWFGVWPNGQDGYDPLDSLIVPGPNKVYFGTYHEDGQAGWTGVTGFYRHDLRAPLPQQVGASQSWLFYVWADPAFTPGAGFMTLIWYPMVPGFEPPAGLDVRLTVLSKPEGIVGGPLNGTIWDLSVTPDAVISLPAYRSADGRTRYVFEFRATVVPEPSSLLALAAGVIPLAGMARRRR